MKVQKRGKFVTPVLAAVVASTISAGTASTGAAYAAGVNAPPAASKITSVAEVYLIAHTDAQTRIAKLATPQTASSPHSGACTVVLASGNTQPWNSQKAANCAGTVTTAAFIADSSI